jgi:N-formylglutamate deformylase
MELLNALTKEKINENNLIIKKIKTKDFLVSIPHGGLLIPFKENLNINREILVGTDMYTDKVYAVSKGIQVSSKINVYSLNVSRSRNGSNDPTLPSHLRNDPFNGSTLTGNKVLIKEYTEEQKNKLLTYYDLYHRYIQESIEEIKKENNFVILFDCHSMNSIALSNTPDKGESRPDVNLGTLNYTSANKKIIELFSSILKESNLTVSIDKPYKGGFITRKYTDINTLQIELKRDLYMNESLEEGNFEIKSINKINSIFEKAFSKTFNESRKLY